MSRLNIVARLSGVILDRNASGARTLAASASLLALVALSVFCFVELSALAFTSGLPATVAWVGAWIAVPAWLALR